MYKNETSLQRTYYAPYGALGCFFFLYPCHTTRAYVHIDTFFCKSAMINSKRRNEGKGFFCETSREKNLESPHRD